MFNIEYKLKKIQHKSTEKFKRLILTLHGSYYAFKFWNNECGNQPIQLDFIDSLYGACPISSKVGLFFALHF